MLPNVKVPGLDDPALKIDWKVPADKIILSVKDKHHERLEGSQLVI